MSSEDRRKDAVRHFGRTALAFDALQAPDRYGWFESARAPGAMVAYRRFGSVDVVLGEPLAPCECMEAVVDEFLGARRAAGRLVLGFFASEDFRRAALAAGASSVQLLAEPHVDPTRWAPRGHSAKKLRTYVRRLLREGFEAIALPAGRSKVPDDFRRSADALMEHWLARGVPRQAHLFELEPWRCVSEKRYFAVPDPSRRGRLSSLLIAHPVHARGGYHFCHLVRDPDARKGVAELVVVKAIETLGAEGVSYASFGPVARPRADGFANMRPVTRHLLQASYGLAARAGGYSHATEFYRKFQPAEWAPRSLVFYPRHRIVRPMLAMLRLGHVTSGLTRSPRRGSPHPP